MKNDVAQVQQTVIESEAAGKTALAKLPRDWVEPVGYFCACKLYLLKTRGPLVANLIYWRSKGLTIDDLKPILRRLCDPDIAQNHNFENQLMADFAALVNDALRRRRAQAALEKRRNAMAQPAGVDAQVVAVMEMCSMPPRPAQSKAPPMFRSETPR